MATSEESIFDQAIDCSTKTIETLVRDVGELRLYFKEGKFFVKTDVEDLQFLRSDVGVDMGNIVVRASDFQPTVILFPLFFLKQKLIFFIFTKGG